MRDEFGEFDRNSVMQQILIAVVGLIGLFRGREQIDGAGGFSLVDDQSAHGHPPHLIHHQGLQSPLQGIAVRSCGKRSGAHKEEIGRQLHDQVRRKRGVRAAVGDIDGEIDILADMG